jgi:hypothetical protein
MQDLTRSVREISRVVGDADLPFGAGTTRVSEIIAELSIQVKKTIKRPQFLAF